MQNKIEWPEGKKFAFTIFDDTDNATLSNVPLVYDFLCDLGFRTTKSVWPLQGDDSLEIAGSSCEDREYLDWLLMLQKQGFEIALHNFSNASEKRVRIIEGLKKFKKYFGSYPRIHANHYGCRDSLYWADKRLTGVFRMIYRILTRNSNSGLYTGEIEGDEYFWGDLCRERIDYMRNFVFSELNTLAVCPFMPYYDSERPFVKGWFASAEGGDYESFCRTMNEENQDRLEDEGGAAIIYTHFSRDGFYKKGWLNQRFVDLMERMAKKGGWFVPVSTLLDYLKEKNGSGECHKITGAERRRLEMKWLYHKVFVTRGTS